jgi:hypothetical protein
MDKYLMTFQNLISRIPKWNQTIIETECKRISEKSGCVYLEDLITCVHIIQLKILTCVRVGHRQKKIDISVPKLDDFIHRTYVTIASKVYQNAYLFDKHASPLQQQKYNREFEVIVEECVLKTIRNSIPTEAIVRAYLDESVEQEEEVIVENLPDEVVLSSDPSEERVKGEETVLKSKDADPKDAFTVPTITNVNDEPVITRLSFNDVDRAVNEYGQEEKIEAPKTIERLEEISVSRNLQRKLEEEETDDEDRLKISDDTVSLDLGIMDLNPFSSFGTNNDSESIILDDIETL